ncbi:hypothetical protein AB0269_09840 [Microbacterium sp. NPDC077644]|uniref:hypothetical protein n=1 Tax=Microbacterium sp. NPDC077644 TaxID=3155055 RepID=UPI00344D5EFB
MSGLEPLIASGLAVGKAAPAAVGRLAAAIGLKLAKSWTWRWRVAWRVKQQTGVAFPSRPYRAWLKEIAAEELRKPVGEVGAALAVRLDVALSANQTWSLRDDRHSAALELVQATYLAAVALSDPGDAALLEETWARSRHDELLGRLAQVTSGRPLLSRADHGELLLAQSSARRRRRLTALGVSEDRVASTLGVLEANSPLVEPGTLVIIVGSFGAGKSELAETWIRQRIAEYVDGASPAVPVWLHASELGHQALEESLARHVRHDEPCAIVVDGLDEVDGQVAARIVDRVGVFVETRDRSVALLTSRHGVLPESNEQQPWDGVSADQARLLIESVSGTSHATWGWNPMLVESVRRPFFAIGAGILLAEGAKASSQADLVRRLVERALATPSSSEASVRDSELYRLLVRASVALVTSGGNSDGLTFQERQHIRATRLITGSESTVEFTLPIFQQWFAAQALLTQDGLLIKAMSDPRSFDRWRWSMSIAGLSVRTGAEFDQFAQILLQANPGGAAWVLDQISSARGWPSRDANEFVDRTTAGARILLATRTWINATGVLAPALFPIKSTDQPISLRVSVRGGVVGTAWDRVVPRSDTVVDLGPGFDVHSDDSWLVYTEGGAIQGYEWPWARQQDRVAKGMSKALENAYRLGPIGGVWHVESRYRLARIVANDRTMFFKPLDRLSIAKRVGELLGIVEDPEHTRFVLDGGEVEGRDLIDLAEWIESIEDAAIQRPLPAPDQDLQTGWVWSAYSDEGLLKFVAEAYGQACLAYDEARSAAFSDFAWSMGTARPAEFGVVAVVEPPDLGDGWTGAPGLTMAVVPLHIVVAETRRFGSASRLSSNGRALTVARTETGLPDGREAEHDYFVDLIHKIPLDELGPFGSRSIVTERIDFTSHSRPATEIALRWIWSDLESVKLAHGTRPRIN